MARKGLPSTRCQAEIADSVVLARGNEHDVEAVGDSAVLVTFGWTDKEPPPDNVEGKRSRIAGVSARVR